MLFSDRITPSEPSILTGLAFSAKAAFFHSPTIHSTKTRNTVFPDGTMFGKLHKSATKREHSALGSTRLETEQSVHGLAAQNWRKDLTENIKEEELEKGLREYLGISQPLRPNTAAHKENKRGLLKREGSSSMIKRVVLGNSIPKKVMTQSSMDRVLRRDLLCKTELSNIQDFTNDKPDEKFKQIKFIKASAKNSTKLLKISTYDVTLIPSDSRRIVIEAIMRDFFLNLIPENSDFLICKNSQNQIYTIIFTGRLVPTCKLCSSITRFEISRDIGFQVMCNSSYCTVKALYKSKLNEKTYECLWPTNTRPDVEQSLPLKEIEKKPAISRIIQSGKFRITDFSRVITEPTSALTPTNANMRPRTTANVMMGVSTTREKSSQMIVKTCQTERTYQQDEEIRPNTVQELVRSANFRPRNSGIRPGTSGMRPGTSGSLETREFKGAPVLREFDDKGMFSKEKEDRKVIEQVSEEVSRNEEEKKVDKERIIEKDQKRKIKGKVFLAERRPVVRKMKKSVNEKLGGFILPLEKKNMFEDVDNSLEDIHHMVNILSKGS